jgi:hypothetical protein
MPFVKFILFYVFVVSYIGRMVYEETACIWELASFGRFR